jgi:peptide-methionine (S)-S-oxide reductase
MKSDTETIALGGGCFWCTEAVFSMFVGVLATTPGYAGGNTKNPTYEEVCTGDTGHAEVLEIEYDPSKIELEKLLDVFFSMHDPTTPNRQGADIGTQYRSIILYVSDEQKARVEKFMQQIKASFGRPVVTEVKRLGKFYPAEGYHQKYYEKNPAAGYCSAVIAPKIKKIKEKYGLH